jgi:RNA-binding protein
MALNGKQKRQLRALGHHLQAVVQVGSSGVTPGVVAATSQALADHELVKVKVALDREERAAALAALVEGTGAEVAQVLGKTALLFLKRKKRSKFEKLAAVVDAED